MSGAAVIIGASGGIGSALVAALKEENTFETVHPFARSFIGDTHIDVTDEQSIAAAAGTLPSGPALNLIMVTTGLLKDDEFGPEKNLAQLDGGWLARNFAVNAIGPALVAKHFVPLMPKEGRCVFAVLSARVGSISDNRLGGWYGYRASKAALNQFVKTLAIEQKRRNSRSIIVALHPGTVDTALSKPFQANVSPGYLFAPGRAAVQLIDTIEGLKPADSGKLFAWDGSEIAP